jgi:hypothetical protein
MFQFTFAKEHHHFELPGKERVQISLYSIVSITHGGGSWWIIFLFQSFFFKIQNLI